MILDEKIFESLGKNFSQANQKEKIVCKCDYCGEVFERMKHNIERSHQVTKSDSCSNKICVQKKRIESNRILFGTENRICLGTSTRTCENLGLRKDQMEI